MVLLFHGIQIDSGRIREILSTTQYGTPISNLRNLGRIGITIEYAEARGEQVLFDAIAQELPVICGVNTVWLPYWDEEAPHAVVLVDITEGSVVVLDPALADAPHEILLGDFLLAWIERDCQYAIIRPR